MTCLPRQLPEFVAVDLSQMATGTTFHASMLQLPEGVEVSNKFGLDTVIASVVTVAEETVTAAPEADAEAAPAADAAQTPAA